MAGDYIPMRIALADDPAVISIATATKLTPDHVVGKLHRLWSWADQHTTDGELAGVPASWIDDYLKKKGFAAAMASTPKDPWLIITPNGVTIPKYERWNGKCAKARLENNRRQQMSREKCDKSVTNVTNVTQQSRAEKSRELIAPALGEVDWKLAKSKAREVTAKLGECGSERNKRMVLGACALAEACLTDEWLSNAVRETKEAHPQKPYAYLQAVLRRSAEDYGINFRAAITSLSLPVKG